MVGAIRLIKWFEGPECEIYLDQIVAACHPTGQRTVERAVASAKAKGWVLTKRKKKMEGRGLEAPTYELAVEPMAFKTARAILNQRANMADRSEEPTRQLELTNPPKSEDQSANMAAPLLEEKDLRERLSERKTLPADAGGEGFQKPVNEIRTYFAQQYLIKHGEQMTAVVFDWIAKVEAQLVKQHGIQKMKTRVLNYFNDSNRDTHPYDTFLRRPDDWAKPREKKGFSKDEYAPKRGRSAAAEMAAEMGLGGDDDDGS